MKSVAAFALVVLSCVPSTAQFGGMGGLAAQQPQKVSVEVELLEMEQDADKSALKEALLLQARQGMPRIAADKHEKEQRSEEAAALRAFIEAKKEAITARSTELTKARAGKSGPAGRAPKFDRNASIEEAANSQVETRLLTAKLALLEEPLTKAIEQLAQAEFNARKDETKRDKATAARKEYDKIKAMHVDITKQLRLEQQQTGFMGGMGGGMR